MNIEGNDPELIKYFADRDYKIGKIKNEFHTELASLIEKYNLHINDGLGHGFDIVLGTHTLANAGTDAIYSFIKNFQYEIQYRNRIHHKERGIQY